MWYISLRLSQVQIHNDTSDIRKKRYNHYIEQIYKLFTRFEVPQNRLQKLKAINNNLINEPDQNFINDDKKN